MDDSTPDIQTLIEKLDRALKRIDELEAENARLRRRVQELECRLGQNSSNSHRPPSTDDPWENTDQEGAKPETNNRRNQGAQPGHQGHHRTLLEPEEVDEFVEIKPAECSQCHAALLGEDIAPWRHQVFEVEVTRRVTEYRMHRLKCDGCGSSERADIPPDVPKSAFGDTVCAWASWLSGEFDLSKRDMREFISRGFGIPISLGSVCALERRAERALGPAHREAVDAILNSEVLWVDETGWFQCHRRHWLWAAVGDDNTQITAFRIDSSRSREALEQLVDPDFEGIISSDRYGAYNARDAKKRQICWQHLVRDFRGLVARDGPGSETAQKLLTISWLIFWKLGEIRRGKSTQNELRKQVDNTWRPATRMLLKRAAEGEHMPKIFKNLLKREAALWTFAYVEAVEATNNRAERAVRPGVIKRKLSFGTQSFNGSRFIERMLTVCQSLRRQNRSVLDFLVNSLDAWRTAQTPPTLVPE